jgi:hypothetical protein
LTAESDIAAFGQTASGKNVVCQDVRGKGMCIDDFDGAMACSVLSSTALESVSAGHGFLST